MAKTPRCLLDGVHINHYKPPLGVCAIYSETPVYIIDSEKPTLNSMKAMPLRLLLGDVLNGRMLIKHEA